MINEALAVQWADVKTIKEERGTEIKISDAQPYVDEVNKMSAAEGQFQTVLDLHIKSVNAHFDILKELTDTVRVEDDLFVEHYQTPPILEILFEEDPSFRDSIDVFLQAIADNETLIGEESIRSHDGFYGPVCVVNFTFSPSNVVNKILKDLDMDANHKEAILSAKSWGMGTSYGIGAVFKSSIEAGNTAAQAVEDEIAMLQMVYDKPIDTQVKLMADAGHTSFDTRKYMTKYKERMNSSIKTAMAEGVRYSNIITLRTISCTMSHITYLNNVQYVQGGCGHVYHGR